MDVPPLLRQDSPAADRILVVDDDADCADAMVLMLVRHGFEAHAVDSGRAALVQLSRQRFDAVVADDRMPGLRGVDLLGLLRASPEAAEMVLVLHTGQAEHAFLADGFADCDLFWPKASAPAEMVRRLRRLLETEVQQTFVVSEARPDLPMREIRHIVAVSQRNNARSGVTGCLVYADGLFAQLLEGDREAVAETLARVHGDHRHRRVRCVVARRRHARLFGAWWMGFVHAPHHAPLLRALVDDGGDAEAFVRAVVGVRPEIAVGA